MVRESETAPPRVRLSRPLRSSAMRSCRAVTSDTPNSRQMSATVTRGLLTSQSMMNA